MRAYVRLFIYRVSLPLRLARRLGPNGLELELGIRTYVYMFVYTTVYLYLYGGIYWTATPFRGQLARNRN